MIKFDDIDGMRAMGEGWGPEAHPRGTDKWIITHWFDDAHPSLTCTLGQVTVGQLMQALGEADPKARLLDAELFGQEGKERVDLHLTIEKTD